MKLLLKISIVIVGLGGALSLLFFLRPPGDIESSPGGAGILTPEVVMDSGKLPGITWVDDIHPIFTRNKCGDCHTRGEEDVIEGMTEFALGIIDKNDPANPFYSYHELVYNEGGPYKINGEELRDGQCCWPRGAADQQQRRIWLGHPERSVLLRKLERNYYDWNAPPRFMGECLPLKWGPPMPLWQKTDHSKDEPEIVQMDHHDGDAEGVTELSLSLIDRMLIHTALWLGKGDDKIMALRPRVSAGDLGMLRYWIVNTFQLSNNNSAAGIHVKVETQAGLPVAKKKVLLIGNYNFPGDQMVKDSFVLQTDENGVAKLNFKPGSVVSILWYAGLPDEDLKFFKKVFVDKKKITMSVLKVIDVEYVN